jgi:ribokinase
MAGRIPKVVVVGPSYVDIAVKCEAAPQAGQIVEGGGLSCMATGPGPNRAIQSALCGCESHLISKVGDDVFGQMVRSRLEKNDVSIDFVYAAQAMSTGVAMTMVDSVGENSGCISEGANRALSRDEVECAEVEQLISSADICLIDGNLSVEVVKSILRTASLYKTKVILEIDVPIRDAGEINNLDWPMEYFNVDILVPIFPHEGTIAGAEQGASTVHKLKLIGSEFVARGAESVIIKMGAKGTIISDRDGMQQIAGFTGEGVLNHTNGSDAFAGALAASCAVGDQMDKAIKFASAAAFIAADKIDNPEPLALKEEIIQLLLNQPD